MSTPVTGRIPSDQCCVRATTVPILGGDFHPIGLPNTGSIDYPWPGLDRHAAPTFAEVLVVRTERAAGFRDHLDVLTADDLTGDIDILENGVVPRVRCYDTAFEEEFWHLRYAERDLLRVS